MNEKAILRMYAKLLDELRELKGIVENPARRTFFVCPQCEEKCTFLPDETIKTGTVVECRCGTKIIFTLTGEVTVQTVQEELSEIIKSIEGNEVQSAIDPFKDIVDHQKSVRVTDPMTQDTTGEFEDPEAEFKGQGER